ncbi:MAG: hypothetical protein GY748_13140 [Planctomycetaceae bacterium]|nr:hypothetical protein [Planctomycetaceae bacterium]
MRGKKQTNSVSRQEREALDRLTRRQNAAQKLVRRARIVLLADAGVTYRSMSKQ